MPLVTVNENYNLREIGPYVHTNTTSRPAGHVSSCFVGETPERSAEESSAAAKDDSCPPATAFSSLYGDIGVMGKGIM